MTILLLTPQLDISWTSGMLTVLNRSNVVVALSFPSPSDHAEANLDAIIEQDIIANHL